MNDTTQIISAPARLVMVQEFGETTTANLIAMGKTCAAEVTEADLKAARGQTVFPFEVDAATAEQSCAEIITVEAVATISDYPCPDLLPVTTTEDLSLQSTTGAEAESISLGLTTEEAIAMANTLEKRCRKNNEALVDLIKRNISQCVALGFVLDEVRHTGGHGTWGKRFGKTGPGCFAFSRKTAHKYIAVAELVANRARQCNLTGTLAEQLRDMLEGRKATTLPVLEQLAGDATSLNKFIADLSMLPAPDKPAITMQDENPAAGLLSVDEMAEMAWSAASKWLTGWGIIMENDWRNMNRPSREAVITALEELLEKARRELNA